MGGVTAGKVGDLLAERALLARLGRAAAPGVRASIAAARRRLAAAGEEDAAFLARAVLESLGTGGAAVYPASVVYPDLAFARRRETRTAAARMLAAEMDVLAGEHPAPSPDAAAHSFAAAAFGAMANELEKIGAGGRTPAAP